MPDYIPEADLAFGEWLARVAEYVSTHAGELPVTPVQVGNLLAVAASYESSLHAHYAARTAAVVACEEKDAARRLAETVVRPVIRMIQASPEVSDTERQAMDITVPKRRATRTPPPPRGPAPVVKRIQPFTHLLRLGTGEGPSGTRRPAGAVGAEVWMRVSEGPETAAGDVDPRDYAFVGMATRETFTATFPAEAGGRRATYRCRWVNTRGVRGNWGPPATATIAA